MLTDDELLIDVRRYPVEELESPRGRAFIERCQADLVGV